MAGHHGAGSGGLAGAGEAHQARGGKSIGRAGTAAAQGNQRAIQIPGGDLDRAEDLVLPAVGEAQHDEPGPRATAGIDAGMQYMGGEVQHGGMVVDRGLQPLAGSGRAFQQ